MDEEQRLMRYLARRPRTTEEFFKLLFDKDELAKEGLSPDAALSMLSTLEWQQVIGRNVSFEISKVDLFNHANDSITYIMSLLQGFLQGSILYRLRGGFRLRLPTRLLLCLTGEDGQRESTLFYHKSDDRLVPTTLFSQIWWLAEVLGSEPEDSPRTPLVVLACDADSHPTIEPDDWCYRFGDGTPSAAWIITEVTPSTLFHRVVGVYPNKDHIDMLHTIDTGAALAEKDIIGIQLMKTLSGKTEDDDPWDDHISDLVKASYRERRAGRGFEFVRSPVGVM